MYINAHVIELNDSEIRVAKDAKIILRSPGFAVIENQELLVGEAAWKKAFLNPRATFNRYWHKMNQDALQVTTRHYRHHADLVYAHLLKLVEQVEQPQEILFTVPGSYSAEQLAMLLGIAAACPFTAVGLVDTAVVAAAAAGRGEYQHIDVHLHQTIITTINAGDSITRTGVKTVAETGLDKIYSTTAGIISDLFIQQSRFDPMHHAESEQSLYDQIPACLSSLQNSKEITLEIIYRNTTHQAKLPREALLDKLRPIYAKITDQISRSSPCLLGDRISMLPGFAGDLPGARIIGPETVFEACQKHEGYIRSRGPELRFITSLPGGNTTGVAASPVLPSEHKHNSSAVTHVLFQNDAYPIGDNTVYLAASGKVTNLKPEDLLCSLTRKDGAALVTPDVNRQILVNGKPIGNQTRLKPGDKIHVAESDIDYKLINVLT